VVPPSWHGDEPERSRRCRVVLGAIPRADAPWLGCSGEPVLNLLPSSMLRLRCTRRSSEQVVQLGRGILARPRALATAGLLLPPCHSLRYKPLSPLLGVATTQAHGRGCLGDRHAVRQEQQPGTPGQPSRDGRGHAPGVRPWSRTWEGRDPVPGLCGSEAKGGEAARNSTCTRVAPVRTISSRCAAA
jgi:hypothetical protein